MPGERCDLRWDRARHAQCPERSTERTWLQLGVLIGTIQRHECRNDDLRLVLKKFPIPGPESTLAARTVLASRAQGLYEPFHRALLGADAPSTSITSWALPAPSASMPNGRNPCKAVSHYREQSRERFLTPEEYRSARMALREAEAAGSMWPPAIAAIRLLMLTGCRKSEILTLKWDDVDRTAGELRLRDGKRGPRMVPLTPPVQKVLDGIERIEGNPWVIRSRKPGACLPDLTYYWNRIQARAGLEGVRVHDLRHSCASMTYNSLAIMNLFISRLIPKSYSHRIHSIS